MRAQQNPLQRLEQLGQSVWWDYIERGFIADGQLAQLIQESGVSGRSGCCGPAPARRTQAYSDVKYVDALIGPDTVTTLPVETFIDYRDHGEPELRLQDAASVTNAREVIRRLAEVGIDIDSVARQLEEDGIRKFIEPYEAMLVALRGRLAELAP